MHVNTHVVGLSGVKIVEYMYMWCGANEMMPYDAFRFHLDTAQTKCVDSITTCVDSITKCVDCITKCVDCI